MNSWTSTFLPLPRPPDILISMPSFPFRPDRRAITAGLVVVASAALLSVGLFSIVASLKGGDVDLPQKGSLEEILEDAASSRPAEAKPAPEERPPAPKPVSLSIPRIGIEAPVRAMGLDDKGYPQVPQRPYEVAWYTFTSEPGQGGNAVFSGHVDWINRWGDPIPGVFYRLRELDIGDLIVTRLEDGTIINYRVTGNVAIPYDDPNVLKVMDRTSRDVITLITCAGTWLKDPNAPFGGNYSHRIIVRAERALDAVSQSPEG